MVNPLGMLLNAHTRPTWQESSIGSEGIDRMAEGIYEGAWDRWHDTSVDGQSAEQLAVDGSQYVFEHGIDLFVAVF